jgi:hypothetical protein
VPCNGPFRFSAQGKILKVLDFKGAKPAPQLRGVIYDLAMYVDTIAPVLRFEEPKEGAILTTSTPTLKLSYSDVGIGVDTATLLIQANDTKLAVTCTFAETSVTCTLTSPLPLGPVTLTATIEDAGGNISPPASIKVRINRRPVAKAGTDQVAKVGETVQLDGSGSSDPDNDPLTQVWSFAVTPDDNPPQFSDPTSQKPTFVPRKPGQYVAQLMVNDGFADSVADTVTVTVAALPPPNRPPVANAGPAQTVTVGATVHLTGAASTDPDGDAISYKWTLPATPNGSTAQLVDATTATPSFTADVAGEYTARLIVNDGKVDSAPDTVKITAEAESPLVIAITAPANGHLTNTTPIQVTGTVDSRATSVTIDGVTATVTGATFAANVPVKEGSNTITAVARTATGNVATASVTVMRDTTPPNVVIESPTVGEIVTTPTIAVVGMVNDIVTGTVNQENCTVEISSVGWVMTHPSVPSMGQNL